MEFKITIIGKIPTNWFVEIINNLKSVEKHAISMGPFGSNLKKSSFVRCGVPIIRGNNLRSFKFLDRDFVFVTKEKAITLKSSWVKSGDIVITHRGTLGQVGLVPEKSKFPVYIVSQSGMKLTCDSNKIDNKFLYYYLNSEIGQHFLLMNKSQVGVPAIARASTSLKNVPVPVPPLNEQKQISWILTSIDRKIEINSKINHNLEEVAQTIFKHWFVDFEFPDENGKPYKSSGGEMVGSEIGVIPKGWKVKSVSDVAEILSGGTPSTKIDKYWNGDIPFFTPKDVEKESFTLRTEKRITRNGLDKCNSKLYQKGTIFITARGTVGKLSLAGQEMAMNQSCYAIQHNQNYQYYMFLVLKRLLKKIISSSNGAVFNAINVKDFNTFKFINAPEPITNMFEHTITCCFELILSLIKQNEDLIKVRDTLLPKLMSGEIRVPTEETVK